MMRGESHVLDSQRRGHTEKRTLGSALLHVEPHRRACS